FPEKSSHRGRRHMANPVAMKWAAMQSVLTLAAERTATRRRSPVRIGYIGALGAANLGDEAMFDAARRLLPSSEFVWLGVPWMEQRLAAMGLSGSRFFDGIFLGGGTLISPYWFPHVKAVFGAGLRIWTFGTGVGSSGFGEPGRVDVAEWKTLLS